MNEQYETLSRAKLQKIVKILEDLGIPQKKIDRIVLAVPFKRGNGPARADVIAAIAHGDGLPKSEISSAVRGYEVGAYVRLINLTEGYHMHMTEGDQCFVHPEDGNTWHGYEIVYFDPKDLALSRGWFIDENMEAHRSLGKLIKSLM